MVGNGDISDWTDVYFKRTKRTVERFGDVPVIYAVFMRRPVVCAPRLAIDWIKEVARARGVTFDIDLRIGEGRWVGAGEPICYISGSFQHLVDLETLFLQKLGPACVAAYNASIMCADLPKAAFLAMDARHCAGLEMADLMAYAASVGSARARRKTGAIGFIGNATDATAHYFGQEKGLGTMPHALIGYAGSTVRAAEMFVETFPGEPLVVLADYFGKEVHDSLEVCNRFPELVEAGQVSFRLDTPGGRFMEGLDTADSYAVLERNIPEAIRGYRTEAELRDLIGPGVSAAAAWRFREVLDSAGFEKAKIVVSSGFGPAKCHAFALAEAPVDV
ncbi:MAG: nicotinate phosphoribosyltransferase, partial [Alphaproteobacteria bacterium]|nr:nicotinate phosphoribosyltransferase [Alphaproteobacteria bacterium]